MSEFAQERLERLLPIFEELQRVQLFSSDEVKRVIKKCKAFEHKLEKRVKDLDDFIRYIQYLIYFLALIRERRRTLKYFYKKKETDYALGGKIESIFRIACARFQGDIGLWLSRIEFAKTQCQQINISRIYVRLLQIHTDKPHLWIAAAKWEFEENGSAENARGLLQRAIRFNSNSPKLYLELFRLELLYMDKLKKRREALLLGSEFDDNQQQEAPPSADDDCNDQVMNGKLARIVFEEAMEKFPGDVNLFTCFAKIAAEFSFSSDLVDYIYECINSRCENCEERWLATAERRYAENPACNVGLCKAIFEEALTRFNTAKMWRYYIIFYLDRLENPIHDSVKLSKQCAEVFSRASECGEDVLDEDLYKKWLSLTRDNSIRGKVARAAVEKYPRSAILWENFLRWRISSPPVNGRGEIKEQIKEIMKDFNRAISSVPEKESLHLWRLGLAWAMQSCPERVDELLTAASVLDTEISGPLKIVQLDWLLLTEGLDAVRERFRRLCLRKPNTLDFYMAYYAIERAQGKLDEESVRNCFEQALHDHGDGSTKLWLTYVEFELKRDPARLTRIYGRAIKRLDEDKVEDFMRDYMLMTKQ